MIINRAWFVELYSLRISRMWRVLVLVKLLALSNAQLEQYTLNFDSSIYVCADEASQAFVDTSAVQVKRHNETTVVMTGVINFLRGFEQDTMIDMVIEKEMGGSYEMMASHEICDMCAELTNPESSYRGYLQYFGFPSECPFGDGNYPIHDFVADTNDLPLNSATAGRYQVTLNMYTNTDEQCLGDKAFIACLKIDFLVEPV